MECKLFKTGGGKLRERELIDTLWNVNDLKKMGLELVSFKN